MSDCQKIAEGLRKGEIQPRGKEPYKARCPWRPQEQDSPDWGREFLKREQDEKRRRIAEAEGCDPEDVHPDRVESD